MDLYLYSTNPAFSHYIAEKYLNKKHYIWCSDKYDAGGAPSSSPCELFISLQKDCDTEDTHSDLIKKYKKTFRKLVSAWTADGIISDIDKRDIIAEINSRSWIIWRPQLYIICRMLIAPERLEAVPAAGRAAIADEWKIRDLDSSEFEIIERVK
jgi:hypothetical protein